MLHHGRNAYKNVYKRKYLIGGLLRVSEGESIIMVWSLAASKQTSMVLEK